MTRLRSSDFDVRKISNATAQRVVVANHYLHRKAPCSSAFGLFRGDELLGVVMYGTPSSAPLRSGICGTDEANNVCELTRLWVDDCVPANGESFLVGNTMRLAPKEIIVSFADSSMGHVGYIYQATNWIYTGLSAKRNNWNVEGLSQGHCQSLADGYSAAQLRETFGDKFTQLARPRKHRYVFFNCDKRRKRELLAKLKYAIAPYPKATTPAPQIDSKSDYTDGQISLGLKR